MSRAYGLPLLSLLLACQAEPVTGQGDAPPPVAQPTPPAAQPVKPAEPATPVPKAPAVGVATVAESVALPLPTLLGKTPAQVEAHLGEPLSKGRTRSSCVRFLPQRVWFECKWVWQRYADKTSTFAAVSVTYEDGKSSAVSFEHLPGAGAFDPQQALSHVGLTLPEAGATSEPQGDTQVWRWFNNQARLKIDGAQYRVELSVREGNWEHSKLDIVLNDPLTEAQKAKTKVPAPKDAPKDAK